MGEVTGTKAAETSSDVRLEKTRRDFLKDSGGLCLALSSFGAGVTPVFAEKGSVASGDQTYATWEDIYRKEWRWDKTVWGSHTNICWPSGSCKFHVYVRNGIVWREEIAAQMPAVNSNYVDYNPLGCQKGSAFNNNLYGNERVKFPLKRVGERGEGKWKRISWDQATTEIAEAIVDSYVSRGPDGFVIDSPHVHSGPVAWTGGFRMSYLMDGVQPDLVVDTSDTMFGAKHTFGKANMGYSMDNLLDAELIVLTHSNISYTFPVSYHFVTEARYKGAEVVVVAPDFNPTAPAADIHVPVHVGCDAAFWLGVCQVMIAEGMVDKDFAGEQTDLPLLVRHDNGKYLSAADLNGGDEKQFYFWDEASKSLAEASRETLKIEGTPALEGTHAVALHDGTQVEVEPVFEILKRRLNDQYTPEKASEKSGVPVSLVKEMGRKIAAKRTCFYLGFTMPKHYHGDLMERSIYLACALSGNWGKPGTGYTMWGFPDDHILFLSIMDKTTAEGGVDALLHQEEELSNNLRKGDPTINGEMVNIEMMKHVTDLVGGVPPVFWNYYHLGYKELWNKKEWGDPTLKKTFDGYVNEAIEKGWWDGRHLRPAPDNSPEVLMLICHNPLRRKRSGRIMYPKHLFPKLKMMFTLETRMSSSAMYCDIVLPCAWYYEKHDMVFPCSGNPFFTFIDKAVEPPGECKQEWEIMSLILRKVGEVASARGLTEFTDHFGNKRRYDELYDKFTLGEKLISNEDCLKEQIAILEKTGVMPKGYTYEKFREEGQVRYHGSGVGNTKYAAANDYSPDKPFYSMRYHVEGKRIYPTRARRAQFYIDHDWYLDAGEELPVHKQPPDIGGQHPFRVTGGHPRVSIHSTHLSNTFLNRLHRGQPLVHINDKDAAALGIEDGDMVRMYNDFSESELMARVAPTIQPKQCVVYFWDAYQYKKWFPYDSMLIGMPKALHLAGGYEQFEPYFTVTGPQQTDRGIRVNLEKAKPA